MNTDGFAGVKAGWEQEFGDATISISPGHRGVICEVQGQSFADVAKAMCGKHGAVMLSLHATDDRASQGTFTLHCILSLEGQGQLMTLTSKVRDSFPSLSPSIYYANWYEREIQDMYGIKPLGHPDPRPLVLYDRWPEGNHPLRKDFDLRTDVPRTPSAYEFKTIEGDGVFEVPVGPVHAGVIEPGHFRFSIAGEPILNLEIRLGYVHRGVEKSLEDASSAKALRMVERISGDNGVAHALAYCQAIEFGSEVPVRARYARCALAELERIYDHLGDIAGLALDTAFSVPAARIYSLREMMLGLNSRLTGHRLLWGTVKLGGTRDVFHEKAINDVQSTLMEVGNMLHTTVQRMIGTPSFMDRVETTGIVKEKAARELRLVGPLARASGLNVDVRRDHSYEMYGKLNFKVPVEKDGDVLARMNVKFEEVKESISLVMEALDRMPMGESSLKLNDLDDGMYVGLVEAPRGELMHVLHVHDRRVTRHKVRDPSFCNWPAIELAVLENIVPDFPLINKSFSLSYAGNDL